MNQELELKLQNAIKESLPQQVGEELKKVLEKAKKDEEELRIAKNSIISLEADVKGLKDVLEKYKQFGNRNAALDAREKELNEKERSLKIEELEYKLNSEKEKTEFTKGVALGLVRNTEYRKDIFNNKHQMGYTDENGKWISDRFNNDNSSVTTKTE